MNLPAARVGPGEMFVLRPRGLPGVSTGLDSRKRILILTADVGFGHRRAAMALASALSENYDDRCAVTVANPMTDKRLPAFLRNAQVDYDRMVRNHMGLEFQMVIVAGGDDKRYELFKAVTWHKPVHIYNFVENMAPFLRAADCIVTKAGGLIVSESLACGVPMLLVDVTPGQEEGNADYVVSSGAAQLATTPVEVLEAMFHWLDQDGALLRQYAALAVATGKPGSAYEIAKTIIEAAESGPQPVPESRKALIPSLKEWLRQDGINNDFIQQ